MTGYETATLDFNEAGKQLSAFAQALLPRYDLHGGPNWGDIEISAITGIGETFRAHDVAYQMGPTVISREVADKGLLKNMWRLGLKEQPGPFGQLYRILATPTFGVKLLFD